jgi:hypothetical protein
MKLKTDWKVEYQKELEHATVARLNGNEGMARVCARRAAGIVIGEYLNRHGHSSLTHRSYDLLTLFISLPDLNPNDKRFANHFLIKVNQDHKFPIDTDLISDVMWLEKSLLGENND